MGKKYGQSFACMKLIVSSISSKNYLSICCTFHESSTFLFVDFREVVVSFSSRCFFADRVLLMSANQKENVINRSRHHHRHHHYYGEIALV